MALCDESVRFSIALVIPKESWETEPVGFSSGTHIALSKSHFLQHFSLHCVPPVPCRRL
jgi:hypothetical protein